MKKIMSILFLAIGAFAFAQTSIMMNDERSSASDGKMFMVAHSFAAATQDIYISTGAVAPRVSISLNSQSALYATIAWYESASVASTTGTLLTNFNVNRAVGVTGTTFKVTYSPTARTTTGSPVTMPTYLVNYGGSSFPKDYTAISPTETSGWVLKKNTKYFLTITPSSATPTTYVKIYWKE